MEKKMQNSLPRINPLRSIRIKRLTMLQKSIETQQEDLLKELYRYHKLKEYRKDGFGSFTAAFQCMQAIGRFPFSAATLRKYFAAYRAYEAKGFSVEELCRYPISSVLACRKTLDESENVQIRLKLMADLNRKQSHKNKKESL